MKLIIKTILLLVMGVIFFAWVTDCRDTAGVYTYCGVAQWLQ